MLSVEPIFLISKHNRTELQSAIFEYIVWSSIDIKRALKNRIMILLEHTHKCNYVLWTAFWSTEGTGLSRTIILSAFAQASMANKLTGFSFTYILYVQWNGVMFRQLVLASIHPDLCFSSGWSDSNENFNDFTAACGLICSYNEDILHNQ